PQMPARSWDWARRRGANRGIDMRYPGLCAGVLAIGVGLCAIGIAMAQEPASDADWWNRVFGRSGAAAAKETKKEAKTEAPVSASGLRAKAEADYLRR